MDKLRAAYRVAVIIGLVMMASLLVYAAIVGILDKGTVNSMDRRCRAARWRSSSSR